MIRIARAYLRAARSFRLPGMLKHFLWPVVVSVAAWVAIGIALWGKLSHLFMGLLQRWSMLRAHLPSGSDGERNITTAIHLALYCLSVPLMLVSAVLLLEIAALPFILEKVARAEYPELERRHGGSQWTSIRRTVVSSAIAAVIMVVTLPLWLVPGFGVVMSLLLSSWLNYRSFSYDVLLGHADAGELQSLPARHRGRLLLMSLGASTLTLVPVVNLLAVPFAGLAFAHYLLHELKLGRPGKPRG
jgi:CysZ protein